MTEDAVSPSERRSGVTALINLRPRTDLRTGLIVSGRIDAPPPQTPERLADVAFRAQRQWRAQGRAAPLAISLHERLSEPKSAEPLHKALIKAGFSPGALTFEIAEKALIARALPLAEALRAFGWRLALRADNACPLPFGERVRSLYQEVVVTGMTPPAPLNPAALNNQDPFARRLLAAQQAGLRLTVEGVQGAAEAKTWLLAGFDCAEGNIKDAATGAAHILRLDRSERTPTALSFSKR
jgi:hypothetical protein